LQIALEWLRQSRGDELSMIFSVWRFIFPSVFAFRKASKSYFLWLWRRDPVLEQASGQWALKSWDEVPGEKNWDQLRRCEKSWEELRRREKRREEMWAAKSWEGLR
jgi:hypothetical protein